MLLSRIDTVEKHLRAFVGGYRGNPSRPDYHYPSMVLVVHSPYLLKSDSIVVYLMPACRSMMISLATLAAHTEETKVVS